MPTIEALRGIIMRSPVLAVLLASAPVLSACGVEAEEEEEEWDGNAEGFDDLPDPDDFEFRAWTGPTSEEFAPLECAAGQFIRGVNCQGSYCDNVSLDCVNTGVPHGASSWSSYFSEEGSGAADERHCAWGDFMTGLDCDGSYCDNLSIRCTDAIGKTFGNCTWSGWYSEETGPFQTPQGRYIKGVECDGSYCDNKRYHYCQMI